MVISVAEKEGQAVTIEEQNGLRITFHFAKFTPHGQEFSFSANTFDNDRNVLLENIFEYYQDYDPDYEAYLWIGPNGHGQNGAPYHIADIVEDMKAAEDMVFQLHTALSNAFNAQTKQKPAVRRGQ